MHPTRPILPLLLVSSHAIAQMPTFGVLLNGLGPTGEFASSASGQPATVNAPPPKQTFTSGVELHAWTSHAMARGFAIRPGLNVSRVSGSYDGPGVLSWNIEETSICLRTDALFFPWGDARDFRGTYLFAGLGLDYDKVDKSSDQLHLFDTGVDNFQPQNAIRPGATIGLGHVLGGRARRGSRWMWELGYHTTLDSRSVDDPPRTSAFKAGFGVVF